MNTFLPHYDRRTHNNSLLGGKLDILENIPIPLIQNPKASEKPLMEEIDRLFSEISNFPKKDPYRNTSGKKHSVKEGEKVEAFIFGKVRQYDKKNLVNSTITSSGKYEELENKLKELMKLHNPNFRYTSIQINKSVETSWHFDRGNVGLSYLIGFGKFKGGGVVVKIRDDKELFVDNHHRWLYFDGHNLEHKSAPITSGVRYAVIFFTKK